MKNIRVMDYGVTSYWPDSIELALRVARQVLNMNGCGHIEQREDGGAWKITHRFERRTGIVSA